MPVKGHSWGFPATYLAIKLNVLSIVRANVQVVIEDGIFSHFNHKKWAYFGAEHDGGGQKKKADAF